MLRSPFARNHSQRARPCSCFTSPAIHFKVTEAEQPDDLKRLRSDLRARGLFYVFVGSRFGVRIQFEQNQCFMLSHFS
jgi:hypothetical protein